MTSASNGESRESTKVHWCEWWACAEVGELIGVDLGQVRCSEGEMSADMRGSCFRGTLSH